MSSQIVARIAEDLKAAMKARDEKVRVSTLRLMAAAIKERDIAARAEDRCCGLTDEEVNAVLCRMVKQREESAETFEAAGRIELAEQERQERAIILEYLPRQLSDAEIEHAVTSVIETLGAAGLKDMGRCMGELKALYAGSMDFTKANQRVKAQLGATPATASPMS